MRAQVLSSSLESDSKLSRIQWLNGEYWGSPRKVRFCVASREFLTKNCETVTAGFGLPGILFPNLVCRGVRYVIGVLQPFNEISLSREILPFLCVRILRTRGPDETLLSPFAGPEGIKRANTGWLKSFKSLPGIREPQIEGEALSGDNNSAHKSAMEWYKQQSEGCPTQLVLLKRNGNIVAKKRRYTMVQRKISDYFSTIKGSTIDHTVVYLGSKLFAVDQASVALNRLKSLEGLLIEELGCSKLTGKRPCNNDALHEMNRLRNLSSDN
ncbi:uncharacterized protein TNCV_4277351 [Trichonephila clavipes]|nr:uncharacterized protein TNCV_4277351 [Trichonephila clavipes]